LSREVGGRVDATKEKSFIFGKEKKGKMRK
jgi:hypothetical protein